MPSRLQQRFRRLRSAVTAQATAPCSGVPGACLGSLGEVHCYQSAILEQHRQPMLHAYLIPGGAAEGWIITQVQRGETSLVLVFGAGYSFTGLMFDSSRWIRDRAARAKFESGGVPDRLDLPPRLDVCGSI